MTTEPIEAKREIPEVANRITRPMTATMAVALAELIDKGGKLIRRQGGYWTVEGEPHRGVIGHPYDWYASTPTIEGLVRRGELEYTEWKDGRNGRFPIAVALPPRSSMGGAHG